MHTKLHNIYEDECCTAPLSPDKSGWRGAGGEGKKKDKYKKVQSAFDKAIEYIHERQGFTATDLSSEPVKALTEETFSILKDAVNTGITHEVPAVMRQALEKNVYIFSGIKSYVSLKEASTFLFDDKGNIKQLPQVKQDVKEINAAYNENYIEAEYRFAIQSAQGADNWQQYQQDGDRYYLQYRTAQDDKVRKTHAALANITLPIDDSFWDNYTPPNGWRCRCRIIQVRKSKYEVTDSETANKAGEKATTELDKDGKNKLAMFRFNPGKEQKIFPDKHPYNKIAPKAAMNILNKQADDK